MTAMASSSGLGGAVLGGLHAWIGCRSSGHLGRSAPWSCSAASSGIGSSRWPLSSATLASISTIWLRDALVVRDADRAD